MTASKFSRLIYALALLGGCISPAKYEREAITLERIAMRDAWLETVVPFALVFCLVLLLVVLYYRRNAPDLLEGLFRPRRAPDVVGALRAWWTNRRALEPFQWLLRLEKHREESEHRAQRLIVERVATIEAERAARTALWLEEEARRALPPLGPPRLGFFSRFGIGFLAGIIVTVILVMPAVAPDPSGLGAVFLIVGGGLGVIISFIASLVCATLVTATSQKAIWVAMICGIVGTTLGALIIPLVFHEGTPMVVYIGGAGMGLAVGIADQASRQPEPVPAGKS
jgi:hypothetical protein